MGTSLKSLADLEQSFAALDKALAPQKSLADIDAGMADLDAKLAALGLGTSLGSKAKRGSALAGPAAGTQRRKSTYLDTNPRRCTSRPRARSVMGADANASGLGLINRPPLSRSLTTLDHANPHHAGHVKRDSTASEGKRDSVSSFTCRSRRSSHAVEPKTAEELEEEHRLKAEVFAKQYKPPKEDVHDWQHNLELKHEQRQREWAKQAERRKKLMARKPTRSRATSQIMSKRDMRNHVALHAKPSRSPAHQQDGEELFHVPVSHVMLRPGRKHSWSSTKTEHKTETEHTPKPQTTPKHTAEHTHTAAATTTKRPGRAKSLLITRAPRRAKKRTSKEPLRSSLLINVDKAKLNEKPKQKDGAAVKRKVKIRRAKSVFTSAKASPKAADVAGEDVASDNSTDNTDSNDNTDTGTDTKEKATGSTTPRRAKTVRITGRRKSAKRSPGPGSRSPKSLSKSASNTRIDLAPLDIPGTPTSSASTPQKSPSRRTPRTPGKVKITRRRRRSMDAVSPSRRLTTKNASSKNNSRRSSLDLGTPKSKQSGRTHPLSRSNSGRTPSRKRSLTNPT